MDILLKDAALNKEPKFVELREALDMYHNDLKRQVSLIHKDRSSSWKKTLYNSLYNLLNEIILTKNVILRQRWLHQTYEWYFNRTERGCDSPRPKRATLTAIGQRTIKVESPAVSPVSA